MSRSSARMDCVVSGSSAEVATSHSGMSGSCTSARAMPTRCFCPPDRLAGYALRLADSPTSSSSAATFFSIAAFGTPAIFSGSAMLSCTVFADNRLKCWNTMPIRRRNVTRPRSSSSPTLTPFTRTAPEVGFSSPLTRRRKVDLPAPLRPMMPKISPRRTFNRTFASATADSPRAPVKTLPASSNTTAGAVSSAGAGRTASAVASSMKCAASSKWVMSSIPCQAVRSRHHSLHQATAYRLPGALSSAARTAGERW